MSEKKTPKNPLKFDELKRKKLVFIFILAGIGIIVAMAYGIQKSSRTKIKKPPPPKKQEVVETENIDVIKETWLAKGSSEIDTLKKQVKELQQQLLEAKKERQSQNFQNQLQQLEHSQKQSTQSVPEEKKGSAPKTQKLQASSSSFNYGYPPPPPPPQNYSRQNQNKKGNIGPRPLTDVIAVVGKEEVQEVEEKKEEQKKQETNTIEIPAGSFVKAILLSGLDAPTGGKAQSMPYPVLLRVIDKSILPNKWQADIKDCFMIGEGIGELSSERVFIRVHTLSCVTESGKTYQKKIKAYVSGEDGKVGLKGRVVSKQGALLARTLVAGFLEGMAKAFAQQNTVVSVSPLGQTQTIDTSKATQIAAVQGLSGATKKLADFYMKLVDQTFPVIEVNAGRKVDVVFLSEVKFGEGK
ncbi:TraB/VirB10 family protein [Desulfurobacterium crinifex]